MICIFLVEWVIKFHPLDVSVLGCKGHLKETLLLELHLISIYLKSTTDRGRP